MIGRERRQSLPVSHQLKERYIKHIRIDETKTLYDIYDFKEEIGHGSYGTVISAIEKQTLKNYAIKIVNKFTAGINKLQETYSEIKILKSVEHPNIILLEKVYESPRKIYMVFERCKKSLSAAYKSKKPFTDKVSKKIIKQLVNAVYYLHKYEIVHRDIKMDNILLTNNPDDPSDEFFIKLTDFGLSIVKTGTGIQNMLKEYCGTVMYMPPELLLQHAYSELCDIWGIGIILYMLLIGNYPFSSANENEMINKICHEDPPYPDRQIISSEAIDLLKAVLQKDPANRITALEIMKHPWLVENNLKGRKDQNVLDYMKKWKTEMQLPSGEESDWISSATDLEPGSCSNLSVVSALTNKAGDVSKLEMAEGLTPPKVNQSEKL